jgi:hypothetical protein
VDATGSNGMDIGRSIDFIRHDPRWLSKIVIGGLLSLVPIFGWLIIGGYYIRIIQRVQEDIDAQMPEWDDWGGNFVRGLKFSVVYLIYVGPLTTLFLASIFFLFIDQFVSYLVLQMLYLFLSLPYVIVLGFFSPLIAGRLAVYNRISAAFHFGELIREARRVWLLLLVYVGLMYAIYMVASFGYILCFVGIFFTSFAGYLVGAHITGQIRRVVDDPDADPRSVTFRVG